tara:strand:+ start:4085 stop:4690 length:606 start_codon:yes stop_codon:yes gene_type:complete
VFPAISKPEEEKLIMVKEIFEDIFDEASALKNVNTEASKDLSSLVRDLRNVEQQIEDVENELSRLKSMKHKLSTEQLPQLMDEMGMEEIKVDGVKVTKGVVIHASIPPDKKDEAFAWLREEGHDDIIKNDVSLSFSRGEDNLAGDVVGMLREKGFDPQTKTHVHPSTLKKFVKDSLEVGRAIDLDLLGAYTLNVAKIGRTA